MRLDWGAGHADYAISGGSATVTVPQGVASMDVGVVAGRLATTDRAHVKVLPSILDLTRSSAEADL